MESQSENEFDINASSDDESIIDRILNDKKNIRVIIKTMTILENLPVTIADITECLLLRLPIRDSSIVSSSTGLSGKVSGGRRKGGRNKSTADKIKNLLTDCGSPSQQLLTIKSLLKIQYIANKVIKLVSLIPNKIRLK